MVRNFSFSDTVKGEVFQRQFNLCAHCGFELRDIEDRAHHVVPDQAGSYGTAVDAFISSAENCVYLCLLCHDAVHQGGKFRDGAMAPPSYFKYSHGHDRAAHDLWVMNLDRLIARKYGK